MCECMCAPVCSSISSWKLLFRFWSKSSRIPKVWFIEHNVLNLTWHDIPNRFAILMDMLKILRERSGALMIFMHIYIIAETFFREYYFAKNVGGNLYTWYGLHLPHILHRTGQIFIVKIMVFWNVSVSSVIFIFAVVESLKSQISTLLIPYFSIKKRAQCVQAHSGYYYL